MFRFFLERQNGSSTEYSSVSAHKWRCDAAGNYALFDESGKMIHTLNIGEVVNVESVNG